METIGVDFGTCNLKTSTSIIIPSKVIKSDSDIFGADNIIEFEDEKYIIGQGEYDTTLDKTKRETFLPMLCLMLGLSTNESIVRIVTGLPINQCKSKAKDILKQIIDSNRVLKFKLNNSDRQIIIEDSYIAPEGIASYYALDIAERAKIKNKDIIILDIGGRTTDIALIKAGSKRKVDRNTSLEFGMFNIYDDLINEINSKYTLGLNIEDGENIIKNGLEVDGEKQDISYIKDILRNNVNKLYKELNINYPVRTSPIIVTGGGGEAFFRSIKRKYPAATLVENYMFSNAIGYKRIGDKIWKD